MSGPAAVSGTAIPRDAATAVPALLLRAAALLPENPHRTTPVPTPYAHPTPRAIRVRRSPR
ncbi:hypothetical protein [Streptomyces sp. NPDC005303]|uniref:hypothetical protein n=1 Tax=Streptomyces sp. NPDC005303 TaxID=3155713 RepID=UPI0033BF8A3E